LGGRVTQALKDIVTIKDIISTSVQRAKLSIGMSVVSLRVGRVV
jgi:hypothetical protein